MKVINNFVIDPNEYLLPYFLISPFNESYIRKNRKLEESNEALNYFKNRFKGCYFNITADGKSAIDNALKNFSLNKDDCVTIFTTSENFYISSCVTQQIEKYCKWSRKIESNTKLIFVNHEFGYYYPYMSRVKSFGLPIIEDYAHSFYLRETKPIEGDQAIYSFPKIFPMQIGGLHVSKNRLKNTITLDNNTEDFILKCLSHYLKNGEEYVRKRKSNYGYISKKLSDAKIYPFFEQADQNIPSVFIFKTPQGVDLHEFKVYMNNHGIQSSVFYGTNAYFVPIHQNLTHEDLDYFTEVIVNYMQKLL